MLFEILSLDLMGKRRVGEGGAEIGGGSGGRVVEMARRAFLPSSYDERKEGERERKEKEVGVDIQMKVKGGVGWKGHSVLSPAV